MRENERQLTDEILARSSGCPDADQLEAYHVGSLDDTIRDRIRSHLLACEPCSAAIAFLASEPTNQQLPEDLLQRTEEWIATASDEKPKRAGSIPRWAWAALATAAMLAVIGFLPLGEETPAPDAPRFRETANAGVRSLVPEEGLSRDDCRLRWTPGPEGSVYRVTVFTEDLQVIVSVDGIQTAEYGVPEVTLDSLEADTLVWRVEVYPPDANRRVSATFVTRMKP